MATTYIHFTEEQKDQARRTDLKETQIVGHLLRRHG